MSDGSEESCLVSSKAHSASGQHHSSVAMTYTDGAFGALEKSKQQSSELENASNESAGHHPQRLQVSAQVSDQCQASASDTGELIDYNDELMLAQFHADAILQAGNGRFQYWTALAMGLGLSGHALQVGSVYYILPSAEIEFCASVYQMAWLKNILWIGLGVGSLFWGGLAGRTGRRKTLLSCMAVSLVFSVIAAFMPTYGPFMMARFTSGVGFGGVVPCIVSYLCETTPQCARPRLLAMVGSLGLVGGMMAGNASFAMLPETGQELMLENKEHFSAWHRFLLAINIPTVAALMCCFMMPESPRYLLQCGREVEALSVYQLIFRVNRKHGGYAFTELEIPTGTHNPRAAAPATVLAGMAHCVNMYWGSFVGLFQPRYRRSTVLLMVTWTVTLFIIQGLATWIIDNNRAMKESEYNSHRLIHFNQSYENENFNQSIDNVHFIDVRFVNCTFRRSFFSHVEFENCTFLETEFANIKTSRTKFKNSYLDDVSLIDTDLTDRHFENCSMNHTKIIRLLGVCNLDFEFNLYAVYTWTAHINSLTPSIVLLFFIGEVIRIFRKNRVSASCLLLAMLISVLFGFMGLREHITWVAGSVQAFIVAAVASLTILAVETCSAFGLFMCCGHCGSMIGASMYAALPMMVTKYAATLTALSLVVPTVTSMMLRDSCSLL